MGQGVFSVLFTASTLTSKTVHSKAFNEYLLNTLDRLKVQLIDGANETILWGAKWQR